jgi:hypothetical protein
MIVLTQTSSRIALRRGEVVSLGADQMGVQSTDRGLVPPEKLGPGLIEQVTEEGYVLVHWLDADLTAYMQPDELRVGGEGARLLVIRRCDGRGECTLVRYRISSQLGFTHNWTVERRPANVVRVVRDDGHAWTFTRHPIFKNINVFWPQPPDDDDAEALTAAELAFSR